MISMPSYNKKNKSNAVRLDRLCLVGMLRVMTDGVSVVHLAGGSILFWVVFKLSACVFHYIEVHA